jgi:hypothetical protein
MELAPPVVPPPAEYWACAKSLTTVPAISTPTAITRTTTDLLDFPRAVDISDAATHAPIASFQILRYTRFIFALSRNQEYQIDNRPRKLLNSSQLVFRCHKIQDNLKTLNSPRKTGSTPNKNLII